ncbi:hemerythrin domain-containing protein [Streptantibioticus cattleyicolor]|uniref:Hemerythrin HHE cation binding domain-containing protein n=1 Tax=Streptantibioticus cattleyicolor (strain ATCC 35852 / DSM 46488 / JCM 4925 / NBRC 14057 / NRRL 8057) TaxID=1003195 RepID=F8JMV3_STREN|nr:hemerythrin domain-containing protein [Streptantibioticus cattleyicolor]AEW99255.1 hemerythrin HHE cation binding domain-containing protein [Streptantibioticus cattleyicolor NRRL 8057 = DSM 46488]CCB71702.1 conserved protein of unknown function [Streptantibioticus cattleyicolor NRRL 8057 = DSM 46488]
MAFSLTRHDAVDVLTRQHAQIRRGFYKAALPGPGRKRAFHQLMRLLSIHEAAEEAHVHPLARRVLRAGPAVTARRRAEEKQAKRLLTALLRTGPDGKGYVRQLGAARRAVLAHAAREEREEFPALRRAVGATRLRLLGAEVRLSQVYAPTRPHRWIDNEVTNKLAAPVLGPLDRIRDLYQAKRGR